VVRGHRAPLAVPSALQLNVVPQPDPVSYTRVGGPRRLVCPSRALAAMASVRQIEKLHTMGTAMVGLRLGGRLQQFHAYRRRWEAARAGRRSIRRRPSLIDPNVDSRD
jgi:hypothetical protein